MKAPRGKRLPRRSTLRSLSRGALVFLVARELLQCRPAVVPRPEPEPPPPGLAGRIQGSIHLALGVPTDADPSDDVLLDERAFVLSYNPLRRGPNWVAWRLDRSNLGRVHRSNDFRPDLSLPAQFYRVSQSDYQHSGYDRGHLCPSADRGSSPSDNSLTFLFTNLLPQVHELNAGPWERLEVYARQRASRGQVIYIVAGGIFGTPFQTIGRGVAVPSANFKVLVILNEGERPSDVSERTEVFAVLMPNQRGTGPHDWPEYATSIDTVEAASGYDFLGAIPERIQRSIEARTNRP